MTGAGRFLFLAAALLVPFLSRAQSPAVPIAFTLLLGGGLLAGALAPGVPWRPPVPWRASLLLAALLGLFHLARRIDPYENLSFLLQLLWAGAFLLLAHRHLDTRRESRSVSLLFAWWIATQGWFLLHPQGWSGGGRPIGGFEDPNLLGGFLVAALGFLVGSPAFRGEGLPPRGSPRVGREAAVRFALWGGAAAVTVGLLAAGSRSGALAALLLWGVALLSTRGWRRGAAAGVLAATLLLPNLAVHRLSSAGSEDPYAFSRIQIWRAAAEMGARRPLAGVGPGQFGFAAVGHLFPVEGGVARYGRVPRGPESDYLRSWAEGGLVGAGALLLFLLPPLAGFPRLWRGGEWGRALPLAGIGFTALFHDLSPSPSMVFLSLACAVLALPPREPAAETDARQGKRARAAAGVLAAGAVIAAVALSALDAVALHRWSAGRERAAADPAGAADLLLSALALDPLHPGAARDLGTILFLLEEKAPSQQGFRAAEEALAEAHRLNRIDPSPLSRLGRLHLLQAERDPASRAESLPRAERALREALSLNPHGVFDLLALARVRELAGDREGTLALLDRAVADEPNFLAAHRERVRLSEGEDPARGERARKEREQARGRLRGKRPLPGYETVLTADQ